MASGAVCAALENDSEIVRMVRSVGAGIGQVCCTYVHITVNLTKM